MAFIGNTNITQAFTPAVDFFSGNASTTAFTLSRPVASVAQIEAYIENVPQTPGTAYTVSGNTITFTSAPPSGTNNIYVYYTSPITQVIAPGQGTVNTTSLANGTVNTSADIVANGLTVGRGAGSVATNTAVGASALAANTTGIATTAIGASALAVNTTGDQNTAVGQTVLGSNTTGSYNTAIGRAALQANTTASNNTAVGYQAGYSNTVGTGNVFNGYYAGYNVTGNYNTAIGRFAFGDAGTKSGDANTAVGNAAGALLTTGATNTFIGQAAGYSMTTGSKNTIIGSYTGNQGGLDIRTSSNYIVLSDGDGNPRQIIDSTGTVLINTVTNYGTAMLSISYDQVNKNGIGIYSQSTTASSAISFRNANGGVGSVVTNGTATTYNTSSDYRLKENVAPMTGALAKVAALKPVTYTWKVDGSEGQGFIAHELQEVVPDAVTGEKDAVDADGNPQYQGIDTSVLVATLTAAIQEQQALIQTLTERITALENK